MGLLTAALVVGAGAAAMGAVNASRQRKQQEAAMDRQETQAREQETQARETNRIDKTRLGGGADIVLGTDEDKGGARRSTAQRTGRKAVAAKTTPFTGQSAGQASFGM